MGFSPEWEECYKNKQQLVEWPWSDVVRFIKRYVKIWNSGFRVIELGCGSGPNIPFFLSLGADYYAIEGSKSMVDCVKKKFHNMDNNIICGDFTHEINIKGPFDLVLDRSALTHNTTSDIQRCLILLSEKLRKGGKFVGIDWFSTRHSGFNKGVMEKDDYTRNNIMDGQFASIGRVHFSDKSHLMYLFSDYSIEVMEHKLIEKEIPEGEEVFASWNFLAVKK